MIFVLLLNSDWTKRTRSEKNFAYKVTDEMEVRHKIKKKKRFTELTLKYWSSLGSFRHLTSPVTFGIRVLKNSRGFIRLQKSTVIVSSSEPTVSHTSISWSHQYIFTQQVTHKSHKLGTQCQVLFEWHLKSLNPTSFKKGKRFVLISS
jgi:hypothetical protein